MPKAVELSVRRGVAGCVWPNSVSVTLRGTQLWDFLKHAPTYDSSTEASTFLMTDATLRMEPFNVSSLGACHHKRTSLLDRCVHVRRKDMMHCCEFEESCLKHDI
jgi:hypothetical protein